VNAGSAGCACACRGEHERSLRSSSVCVAVGRKTVAARALLAECPVRGSTMWWWRAPFSSNNRS
jgi:hypothetical protein